MQDALTLMKTGDRVCYRAGTTPSETGTVIAVTPGTDGPILEILLDSGARIKVAASHDWTLVAATAG